MQFNIVLIILLSLSHVAFGLPTQENTRPPLNQYQNDPCGDPRRESMAWAGIEGKVVKVSDGDTVIISIRDKNQVTVHLVGAEAPKDSKLRSDSRLYLEKMALNSNVLVLVNPSDWDFKKPKPNEVTGVVNIGNVKDANLAMIESGMARYKAPNPYEMSDSTACRYKKAEDKAREEKRGLWQDAR